MINLLELTGGSQRPQVYTQFQLSSYGDLTDMREGRDNGFIQIRTAREKTKRSLRMPFVLLPAFVLKYIEFYYAFVRLSIIDAAGRGESHVSSRPGEGVLSGEICHIKRGTVLGQTSGETPVKYPGGIQ